MIPWITVLRGPYKGLKKKIPDPSFSIGRKDENELCIKDIFVSLNHCLIKRIKEKCYVLFDNSANGTLVNGRKIHNDNVELSNRTIIGVGPALILFEIKSES